MCSCCPKTVCSVPEKRVERTFIQPDKCSVATTQPSEPFLMGLFCAEPGNYNYQITRAYWNFPKHKNKHHNLITEMIQIQPKCTNSFFYFFFYFYFFFSLHVISVSVCICKLQWPHSEWRMKIYATWKYMQQEFFGIDKNLFWYFQVYFGILF